MQLKLRRSQREAGIVSTNVIFCLDARADLTEQERANLARYKLYDQVIYNSEASRRHLLKGEIASIDGSVGGSLKGLMHVGLAAMRLNVTVRSLERGQHIECKSLEELIGAEDAIKEACQTLKVYLDVAATFNGAEMVVDYSGDEPRIVAQAVRPEPILAPPAVELAVETRPAIELTLAPRLTPAATEATLAPFATNLVAESSYQTADYQPNPSAIDSIIANISKMTGLSEGPATMLAIGFVVVVLGILYAAFHG